MDFLYKFEAFCKEHKLLEKGDRILLAISGGVDSVVLLNLFYGIRDKWDLSLSVAHLNHRLRGREADRDEAFVRKLSEQKDLPFYSERRDVKAFAKIHRLSLEEAARKVRFEFLSALLSKIKYDRIALGHHANDQAETILMNLARGSGLRGLRGIQPIRGTVIHPLLFARKKDILSYAEQNELEYMTDTTNRDRDFLRNRVRWDVFPRLEATFGAHVVASICRAGNVCTEAEEFLEHSAHKAKDRIIVSQTRDEIILDIHEFFRYFKVVQKVALIQIIEDGFPRIEINASAIDRLIYLAEKGRSGNIVELNGGVTVVRSGDHIVLLKARQPLPETPVRVGQETDLSGIGLKFRSTLFGRDEAEISFTSDRNIEYLDYDKIANPLCLRSHRSGDKFVPLGMDRKKKVHDLFVDEKVPNYRRSSVPILVGGNHIIWIVGLRIDDRFKITDETQKILKVEIIPEAGRNHD
jgi:tRNA(Ile)-lysidine synthase